MRSSNSSLTCGSSARPEVPPAGAEQKGRATGSLLACATYSARMFGYQAMGSDYRLTARGPCSCRTPRSISYRTRTRRVSAQRVIGLSPRFKPGCPMRGSRRLWPRGKRRRWTTARSRPAAHRSGHLSRGSRHHIVPAASELQGERAFRPPGMAFGFDYEPLGAHEHNRYDVTMHDLLGHFDLRSKNFQRAVRADEPDELDRTAARQGVGASKPASRRRGTKRILFSHSSGVAPLRME